MRQVLRTQEQEPTHQRYAAIRTAFTPREQQVLGLLVTGITNKLIANQLGISERTVDGHVRNILAKLGVCSRTEAIAAYYHFYPRDDDENLLEKEL